MPKVTEGWYRLIFELVGDTIPTDLEVTAAQLRGGYHPEGYGGPWDIQHYRRDGKIVTQWWCSDSCP